MKAVLLDPEVKTTRRFYAVQCKAECATNNHYFGYGEIYMKKCTAICDKNYAEYLAVYDTVKAELGNNISKCMSSSTDQAPDDKNVKKCILNFQKEAIRTLGKTLDKIRIEDRN